MKENFLNISGKIESIRLAALEVIANTAHSEDIPFFIVGATARDLIIEKGHNIKPFRATLDIDIGVRVPDWTQYNKLKEGLVETGKFKKTREYQRLIFQNKLNIDLIPFGPIADKKGSIKWPPEKEIVMHIIGFEEAFTNSQTVRLRDDPILDINVVTLAGLAIMKIVSWNDGYPNRRKDAADLALIISKYLDAGNSERLFNEHSDLLEFENFDYVNTGARLLGRDIAPILSSDLKEKVLEVLDKETGKKEGYKLIQDMLMSNSLVDENFESLLGLLEEVKKGVFERL
ncbi:MAG: nucleotidyl transferase AbiEii/AbiGii toxin family protein [Candidatus Hodarchaeota archaeon]